MTTKAEALRDMLRRAIHNECSAWIEPVSSGCDCEACGRAVVEIARTIVEQLGITEECKCDAYSQSCSYCTANVEATQALLELAHHGE